MLGTEFPHFHKKVADRLPSELAQALEDVVETIASLTERIRDYERRIEQLCKESYPQESGLCSDKCQEE